MHSGLALKAKNFTIHPKFSMTTLDYDAAVIELQISLNFTKTVRSIKLAKKEPPDQHEVRVSGWGFIKVNLIFPRFNSPSCKKKKKILNFYFSGNRTYLK